MEEKKVVLITGGAMGQGRAHAYKYAENGFNVVLADMLEPSHEAFKETRHHVCPSIISGDAIISDSSVSIKDLF